MTDRWVGSEGLNVDVVPPFAGERQTGSVGLRIEYTFPLGVQVSHAALSLDIVAVQAARRLGSIGMMIDYVPSLVAANAARWGAQVFEMGTSSPLVYWSAGAFQSSGTTPVVWNPGAFG